MSTMTPIPHPNGVLNPATGRPLPHVNKAKADQLHNVMVGVAVKGHAGGVAYLRWQAAAFDRIGRLTRTGAEAAFKAWEQEVVDRTGRMPPML